MGALYKLTFPSGKSYIGITGKTVAERFRTHVRNAKHRNFAISNAVNKYGVESISIETLFESDDWELLCVLEIDAIKSFNTRSPHGYNTTAGGDGVSDRDEAQTLKMMEAARKPERRKRIAETVNQRLADPEYRELHFKRMLEGRTEEVESRRIAAVKAMLEIRYSDAEYLEKLSNRHKGVENHQSVLSVESVHAIRSLLRKGLPKTEIAKMFGVHPSTIYMIEKKKKWGWLSDRHNDLFGPI